MHQLTQPHDLKNSSVLRFLFSILVPVSMNSTYKTVKGTSEGLYKEKGSKFIGISQACYTEDEAKELLGKWKNDHHQAGHGTSSPSMNGYPVTDISICR